MSEASIKVSKELQTIADELRDRLNNVAGTQVQFSLFVWTEGRASYISTASRKEVIETLEIMIRRWKEGMPDIPAHEVRG